MPLLESVVDIALEHIDTAKRVAGSDSWAADENFKGVERVDEAFEVAQVAVQV